MLWPVLCRNAEIGSRARTRAFSRVLPATKSQSQLYD
jgi:hypothetical protein